MTPTRLSKTKNPSAHPNSTGKAGSTIILDTSNLSSEDPPSEELPKPTPQTRENSLFHPDEFLRRLKEEVRLAEEMAAAAKEKAVKAASEARRIEKQANRGKLTTKHRASSPVARKLDRERAISIERSPRRQSGVSTAPPSPEKTSTKTTNQPKVVISQHEHDTSHGFVTPATDKSRRVAKPTAVPIDKPIRKPPVKRKQSIGGEAYTPDPKRPKTTPPSSLKKRDESTPQTPNQTAHFDSDDDSDMKILDQTIIITPKKRKNVIKKAPKPTTTATPESKKKLRSSVAKSLETKRKVGKVESAGKAAEESASKTKGSKVVEEEVNEDKYEPRTEVQRKGTRGRPVKRGGTKSGARGYVK